MMMMMMIVTNTITDSVCIPLGPGILSFLWMFPDFSISGRPWILQEILEKKIHAKSHVWRFPLEPLCFLQKKKRYQEQSHLICLTCRFFTTQTPTFGLKKVPCFKSFSFGVWNIPKVGVHVHEIPPLLASGPNDAKTETWCLRWSCCFLSIHKKLWCSTRGLDNPLFPVLSTDLAVDFWGTSFWEHFDSWYGMIQDQNNAVYYSIPRKPRYYSFSSTKELINHYDSILDSWHGRSIFTGWWFQTCFMIMFIPIWGNDQIWLEHIIFRWVGTYRPLWWKWGHVGVHEKIQGPHVPTNPLVGWKKRCSIRKVPNRWFSQSIVME